jgi:hypothetical protein
MVGSFAESEGERAPRAAVCPRSPSASTEARGDGASVTPVQSPTAVVRWWGTIEDAQARLLVRDNTYRDI